MSSWPTEQATPMPMERGNPGAVLEYGPLPAPPNPAPIKPAHYPNAKAAGYYGRCPSPGPARSRAPSRVAFLMTK